MLGRGLLVRDVNPVDIHDDDCGDLDYKGKI